MIWSALLNNLQLSRIFLSSLIIYLVNSNSILCHVSLRAWKILYLSPPLHKESVERFSNRVECESLRDKFNDRRKNTIRNGCSLIEKKKKEENLSWKVCFAAMRFYDLKKDKIKHIQRNRHELLENRKPKRCFQLRKSSQCGFSVFQINEPFLLSKLARKWRWLNLQKLAGILSVGGWIRRLQVY